MADYTDARDAKIEVMADAVQTYLMRIDPKHTPDDILKPHYWLAAPMVQSGDYLQVETQDVSWAQTLRVMEVDQKAARVIVAPAGPVVRFERGRVPSGYEIRFIATNVGFQILNAAGEQIGLNFRTHQGALAWLMGQVGEVREPAPRKQRETADV